MKIGTDWKVEELGIQEADALLYGRKIISRLELIRDKLIH
jgi:hypothetical protein